MWYDRTVGQIREIVRWLQSTDEEGWADQTHSAIETLGDIQQMAASKRRRDKEPVEIVPGDPNAQRALPHIQAMISAMQRKDRRLAVESGRAALKEF